MYLSGVVDLKPGSLQFHNVQLKLPCTVQVDRPTGWIRLAPDGFNDRADQLLAALEDDAQWQALPVGQQYVTGAPKPRDSGETRATAKIYRPVSRPSG
ncbi:MAG: hypothetical protein FJ100_07565 [Deltaproteobacteria bacterium]|nr:hypothetical protein [Deltaproteobacteria bacterium]